MQVYVSVWEGKEEGGGGREAERDEYGEKKESITVIHGPAPRFPVTQTKHGLTHTDTDTDTTHPTPPLMHCVCVCVCMCVHVLLCVQVCGFGRTYTMKRQHEIRELFKPLPFTGPVVRRREEIC